MDFWLDEITAEETFLQLYIPILSRLSDTIQIMLESDTVAACLMMWDHSCLVIASESQDYNTNLGDTHENAIIQRCLVWEGLSEVNLMRFQSQK